MKIYLIRHGMTEWNAEGRYLGRTDEPLCPKGLASLAPAGFSVPVVYASTMRRATQTARILFPEARVQTVEGMQEMDFGVFEGRTWREMSDDSAYREWVDGGCVAQCPNGESMQTFTARVCDAFERLMSGHESSEPLVIVAHGGTLMSLLSKFALPHRDYFEWHAGYGSGYLLDSAAWDTCRKLRLESAVSFGKEC